jgi:hypothetical protein
MAKTKKGLKMRRRNTRKNRKNNKKNNKKGGVGMLTPPGSPIQQQGSPNFIDVDTPESQGSLHLSDLETTPRNSESGITDNELSVSGFQGLNLTQQFDDAASASFNTEGEDSLSSMDNDNAVPGQQGDDAASFASIGHGGKRKSRKSRKTRRR